MVKRYWKYAVAALLLTAILLAGAGYWLLATTAGARWLAESLMRRSAVPLAVQHIEGRLCDELRLSGVEAQWPDGAVDLETLHVAWRPAALLRGKLLVTAVAAKGVHLVTTAVERPPVEPRRPLSFKWPEQPAWTRWLNIELRRLQLEALQWQRPDQPPLLLERFAGRLHWTGSRLKLDVAELVAPQGSLQASLKANWGGPRLTLQAAAQLTEQAGLAAGLQLSLQLQPGKEAGALAGKLKLTAASEPTGELTLTSGLQLDAAQLALTAFELAQTDRAARITGHARLSYGTDTPQLELQTELSRLDLTEIAGQASDLNGTLELSGWLDDYRGRLDLSNRGSGWQKLQLASPFAGNRQQITFSQLRARALEGRIGGELAVVWQPLLEVRGKLSGEGLDPAILRPDWPGTIAFQAEGFLQRPSEGPLEAALRGRLLDSTLRGYELRGKVDGRLQGDELELAALELQGPGVSLSAKGALQRQLDVRFQASDLTRLLPDAAGTLQGRGWLRWRDRQLAGALRGGGRRLRYGQYRLANFDFDFARPVPQAEASLDLRGLQGPGLPAAADVRVRGGGLPDKHRLEASVQLASRGRLELALAGGYDQAGWQGTLKRLLVRDEVGPLQLVAPTPLTLSRNRLQLKEFQLQGSGRERIAASVDADLQPFFGQLTADWRDLNLARINAWQSFVSLSGQTTGKTSLAWPKSGKGSLTAELEAAGQVRQQRVTVDLSRVTGRLNWDRSGLQAEATAELVAGGRLRGTCRAEEPFAPAPPSQGNWQLEWRDFDLQPWLAGVRSGLLVEGRASGLCKGSWGPGGSLTASGNNEISGGRLAGHAGDGLLSFALKSASARWDWQGQTLTGETSFVLEDYGRLNGSFQLPIPARLPLVPTPEAPLAARLSGRVQEQGLIALLLPGVVQESRGQMTVELTAGGVWRKPVLSGSLQLAKAGAYLPAAGIELKDVQASAEFRDNELRVNSLTVQSGPGQLRGDGVLRLQNWRVADYEAKISGERFQAVDLPGLQAQITPQLTLRGTPVDLAVKGRVTLEDFLLREFETASTVKVSEDVVLVDGKDRDAEPKAPLAVTADIDLLLGEHVLVKAAGLDARLEGQVKLKVAPGKTPAASGRISVAEGAYSAYGAKLGIERGNLLFSGGRVSEPTLDILALRTVGKVKAGVRVAGTPRAPRLELYSEPPMSNNDRLAYIVLGRPVAQTGEDVDLLMTAAGALLSQGESVVLQDQLKRQLGVDVLGIEAGEGDVTSSMLTVGKYLSPELYVSYGRSLFTEASEFRMRYSLGEHWELESKTGTESGVDLYYKIEFR